MTIDVGLYKLNGLTSITLWLSFNVVKYLVYNETFACFCLVQSHTFAFVPAFLLEIYILYLILIVLRSQKNVGGLLYNHEGVCLSFRLFKLKQRSCVRGRT